MSRRRVTADGGAAVYDGRNHVGTIEPAAGGRFLAKCLRGRALGTYPTRKEAIRAVLLGRPFSQAERDAIASGSAREGR